MRGGRIPSGQVGRDGSCLFSILICILRAVEGHMRLWTHGASAIRPKIIPSMGNDWCTSQKATTKIGLSPIVICEIRGLGESYRQVRAEKQPGAEGRKRRRHPINLRHGIISNASRNSVQEAEAYHATPLDSVYSIAGVCLLEILTGISPGEHVNASR